MKRPVLVLLCVIAVTATAWSQGFTALLTNHDALTYTCGGGEAIADGYPVLIFQDMTGNGPSPDDVRPTVGNQATQVNFNEFTVNGIAQGIGAGRFYTTTPAWTAVGAVPIPSTFYVVVCVNDILYYSGTFAVPMGFSEVHFGGTTPQRIDWFCLEESCATFEVYLPVELVSFEAIPGEEQIALRWRTASENGNDRFDIRRDSQLLVSIPSLGNDAAGHHYSYVDLDVASGIIHTYELLAVGVDGRQEIIGAVSAASVAPSMVTEYVLHTPYPNPFNASTTIAYDLPEAGTVSIRLYDVQGREAAILKAGHAERGSHVVRFDASGLASGIYFVRFAAGEFEQTRKLMLMK